MILICSMGESVGKQGIGKVFAVGVIFPLNDFQMSWGRPVQELDALNRLFERDASYTSSTGLKAMAINRLTSGLSKWSHFGATPLFLIYK
jgi:hypothetical protein